MTKQHDDSHSDELVSASYQELAREITPEYLDQAVLQMAADRSTTVSSRPIWLKPLAWAATLGLSLAIVLELSRLPDPDANRPALIEETFPTQDLDVVAEAEDAARLREGPNQEQDYAADPEVAQAEVRAPAAAPALRKQAAKASSPAAAAETDTGVAFELSADIAEQKEHAIENACDEAARGAADTWLACVDALRRAGRDVDANVEYDLLRERYPEILPNK